MVSIRSQSSHSTDELLVRVAGYGLDTLAELALDRRVFRLLVG